jgi:transposase
MMTERLSPEEVALLIRARKLLKDKGLPNGVDVKTICEIAGVSRKTGYQWANGLKFADDSPDTTTNEEMSRLKSEHEQLKERCRDLEVENEGHRLAWEIHGVDKLLDAKKNITRKAKKKKR